MGSGNGGSDHMGGLVPDQVGGGDGGSGIGVGVGHGVVSVGQNWGMMSVGHNRGSLDNGGGMDNGGNVMNIGGSMVDNGGNLSNGVNESVLVVVLRVTLEVDVLPASGSGHKWAGGRVNGASGGTRVHEALEEDPAVTDGHQSSQANLDKKI